MKAIYLDNFRGFQNTIIPLEKVNFLVGENSTGKSSVLTLLEVITEPSFQFTWSGFPSDKLGGFEDIISAGNKRKKRFSIGYILQSNKNENRKNYFNFLIISYKKQKDEIEPFKLTYSDKKRIITIKLLGKENIQYRVLELPLTTKKIIDKFKKAIEYHHSNDGHFENIRQIKKNKIPIHALPFIVLPNLIRQELNESEIESHPFETFLKVVSIAPIREKPKRIYESLNFTFSSKGSHTPIILNDISNSDYKPYKELKKSLIDFGLESGLFNDLVSKRYGDSTSAPFEINITLSNDPIKLPYVGYGVSQVLPIIVESLIRKERTTLCIQQPEVHLHPKAQAALGKFFYMLADKHNKQFLIETHSDFLIDRYRYTLSKSTAIEKPSSQIIYFERDSNNNIATCVPIEKNGNYSINQPPSFRNFFIKEQLDLLEIG